MNYPIDRRSFLKQAGVAGVSVGLGVYASSSSSARAEGKIGPNDKITAAVIGTNGRGMAHIECLTNLPNVEITHICDVDTRAVPRV